MVLEIIHKWSGIQSNSISYKGIQALRMVINCLLIPTVSNSLRQGWRIVFEILSKLDELRLIRKNEEDNLID